MPLLPGGKLDLKLSSHFGLLLPLGSPPEGAAAPTSHICDRFFLGGPGTFWGFRTHGVGPHEPRHGSPAAAAGGAKSLRDAVGGDVSATATAALSTPLPGKLAAAGVRAQVFGTVGGLHALGDLTATGGSLARVAGSFVRGARACVGAGIVVPTGIGRIEFNLTHVLRKRPEDAARRSGWQVGVSGSIV